MVAEKKMNLCVGWCWLVYYCAYVCTGYVCVCVYGICLCMCVRDMFVYVCTGYVCVCVYVDKYPTVGLVLHDDSHCLF